MKRHEQDKPYPSVWWLNWWFTVRDGAGWELAVRRVSCHPAPGCGRPERRACGTLRRPAPLRPAEKVPPGQLLPAIAPLKLVLPLPSPGWALQGGTAGSAGKGQVLSGERIISSPLPLSSLAVRVTCDYAARATQRGALWATSAARQTGRCPFLSVTCMTGCHKVVCC